MTIPIENFLRVPRSELSVRVIGIIAGPGPSVPAMVVARSCCMMPITSPVLAIFIELERLGSTVMHVCTRHRELRRTEAVERMAERVHAVAVHFGDRSGRTDLEVAVHQRDADRITGA